MADTDNLQDDLKQTGNDAASSFNQLKDDAGRVAQSAADVGRAGVETVKAKLNDGREAVRAKISDGQAAVQDASVRAKAKGNELVSNLSTQIEQNPLQAIAIAAGVGVVVGLLLRR